MKTEINKNKVIEITPYKMENVVVGLVLDNLDHALLRYLHFLTNRIVPNSVTFTHIVPSFSTTSLMTDEAFTSTLSAIREEDLIQRMKRNVDDHFKTNLDTRISYDVREGDVLKEFLDVVEENLTDLIVIGREGEKTHHQVFVKNTIRQSKASILLVPEYTNPTIKRIIVPTDFSINALRALKVAIGINKQLETPVPIICVHVYAMKSYSHFKIDRPWNVFREDIQKNINGIFEDIKSSFSEEDAKSFSLAMIEGNNLGKANYITEYANQTAGNLIVMGSKGHSRVQQLILGSVTEKVIKNNNTVPMIIVK